MEDDLTPEEEAELAALEAQAGVQDDLTPEEEAELRYYEAQQPTMSAARPSPLQDVTGFLQDKLGLQGREVMVTSETDPVTGRSRAVGHGERPGMARTAANAMELAGGAVGGTLGAIGGEVTGGPPGAFLGATAMGAVGAQGMREVATRFGLRPDNVASRSIGEVTNAAAVDFGVGLTLPLAAKGTAALAERSAGATARFADVKSAGLGAFLDKKRQTVRMLTDNPMDARRTGTETIYNAFKNVEAEVMNGVPLEPGVIPLREGGVGLPERVGQARIFPKMLENTQRAAQQKWGPIVGGLVNQSDGAITVRELGIGDWFTNEAGSSLTAESTRAINSVHSSVKKMIAQGALSPEDHAIYSRAIDTAEAAKESLAQAKMSPGSVSDAALIQAYDAIDAVQKYDSMLADAPLSAQSIQAIKESVGDMSRFDSAQLSNLAEAAKPGYYRDVYGLLKEGLNKAISNSSVEAFQTPGGVIPKQQAIELFKKANEQYSSLKTIEKLLISRAEAEKFEGPYFKSAPFGAAEGFPVESVKAPWYKRFPGVGAALSADVRAAMPMSNTPAVRAQYVGGAVNFPFLRGANYVQQMSANMAVRSRDLARGVGNLASSPVAPILTQALGPVYNEFVPRDASALSSPNDVSMAYARELAKVAPSDIVIQESIGLRQLLEDRSVSPADKEMVVRQLALQHPGMFAKSSKENYTSIWNGKFADPREASMHTNMALSSGDLTTEARVLEKTLAGKYEPFEAPDYQAGPIPQEAPMSPSIDMENIEGAFSMPSYQGPVSATSNPEDEDPVARMNRLAAGTDRQAY
jgi:hypothetical protein